MQRAGATTLGCGTWDLILWLGIESRPHAMGTQTLSHWTTMEVPEPWGILGGRVFQATGPVPAKALRQKKHGCLASWRITMEEGDLSGLEIRERDDPKSCSLCQVSGFYFDLKNDCKFLSMWKYYLSKKYIIYLREREISHDIPYCEI